LVILVGEVIFRLINQVDAIMWIETYRIGKLYAAFEKPNLVRKVIAA